MNQIKVKHIHDFSSRTKVQACRSLMTGWSLGALAHSFVWVPPHLAPPERARIAGDWQAVGKYLSNALEREKRKIPA